MNEVDDSIPLELFEVLAVTLPMGSVGPDLRERVLQRAAGPDRFLPFLDRVMEMFDLPEPLVRNHLGSIDASAAWDVLVPGIRYRDFEGGAALGDAHGGLVRIATGQEFPRHHHLGPERVLVLQGELADDGGRVYRAGDVIVSDDGTSHSLRALGPADAVYAVAVVAIEFEHVAYDDDDDDDD